MQALCNVTQMYNACIQKYIYIYRDRIIRHLALLCGYVSFGQVLSALSLLPCVSLPRTWGVHFYCVRCGIDSCLCSAVSIILAKRNALQACTFP